MVDDKVVFSCDLFLEPDCLSRLFFSDDGVLGFGSVVRFGSDSLSPVDLAKFVSALESAAIVDRDASGVPSSARFRVSFIKVEGDGD